MTGPTSRSRPPNWTVLGTNMGAAKGPLAFSVIEGWVGDASGRTEYHL
ncbi:MAG: hypothetical protein MZV64_13425 [Ignavibacteriales bacterium]|nr:hypothetical protein [Ignavibacteriales bacterium]